jgi:hypothetical protein
MMRMPDAKVQPGTGARLDRKGFHSPPGGGKWPELMRGLFRTMPFRFLITAGWSEAYVQVKNSGIRTKTGAADGENSKRRFQGSVGVTGLWIIVYGGSSLVCLDRLAIQGGK